MARQTPSSIDRLPDEIRDMIADLRRQGRTIDEILEALRPLDVEVSRSALGRHVKSLAQVGDQLRRAETMAKFVVEKFGDEPDERIGRANMRILQGALLELLTEERLDDDGQPVTLSAEEAKSISLSLQRLVSAQRTDADRAMKMRAEARAEAAREAATAVEKVAKREGGLSKETVDAIKAEILGIR
ncbi:phage protein Gp27 family protein [Phenylobacterium sp. 58.2.17]|uniref:phage protein Gp27 family protein n=1 Tax=Phenylobacterium sp. 58.2.17 TaxID=2969306 RepID=UPI0022643417|nr:phage protein Gp27 family protein [Phenylobacterium sp. 58.2.17]MCX7586552.1 DUF3486 family protein [Phenylobacterium sp. 58.2.17]